MKNLKLKLANNAFELLVKNDASPTTKEFSSWFHVVTVTAGMYGDDASTLMYKIFDYINNNYKENKKETIISVAEYFVDEWHYWYPFTDNLYKKLIELNSDGYVTDIITRCLEKGYKESREYTPDPWKYCNPKKTGYDNWEKAYLEKFPERKDEVEKNFNERYIRWKKYSDREYSEEFWQKAGCLLKTVLIIGGIALLIGGIVSGCQSCMEKFNVYF